MEKDSKLSFFESLLENIERVVYRLNLVSGEFEYISGAATSVFGVNPATADGGGMDLVGRHMEAGDYDAVMARIADVASRHPGERVSLAVHYRIRAADGRIRHCHDTLTLEVDGSGKPTAVFGVAVDVSERVEAEAAMREKESRFSATMEAAQVGIFVLQDGVFRYANRFLLDSFGYEAEELIDKLGPPDLVVPAQRERVRDQMRRRAAGEPGRPYELTALRKDGSTFPVVIQGAPATYHGEPASVGTLLDVSVQKEAEERARELAYFDTLTGLPNRRLLNDRCVQLLAAAERDAHELAVIFIDLDHFKRVNDSLGHTVGDELLRTVSIRLGTVVRRIDTLARLGGDEFIVVLPGTSAAGAAEVAARLAEVCSAPYFVAGHELTVTPSLGIAMFPADGRDFETLLRNADAAMFKAKESGRNGVRFYSSEMNLATLRHLLLESGLRRGIGAREFVLHYQPLVETGSGKVIGAEALIRWKDPEAGLIFPDQFIHVAEDMGLINPIGDWVLREACRQARAWQEEGLPPLVVAVNVSPVQFRQPGFVDSIAAALADSGLAPQYLELELTERTVMHDAEHNIATLAALAGLGVELALDDFGTGYSSLAYLKRFPVSKLKIDRSFVRDLEADAEDRAIASTILSMGRSLHLKVLAEGVESEEQAKILREMGCELVQGYLYSRPLPADEFAAFMRSFPQQGNA